MTTAVPSDSYEFGDFRLDARSRLLTRRNGATVPVPPRIFEMLLYLVQHTGQVLEKECLMEAIWPDSIVQENNLSQSISDLRRILGESPGSHRFIVTVPGRGYRFVADVKAIPARENILKPAAPKTLAVLPFKPLLLENRDAVLEMGMADTLIARLSTIRQLVVRPLSSVRKYADVEQEPLLVGRELGVGSVLDGSIHQQGENIRVTVRLINTADGVSLWAGTFQEKLTDIFEVQDRIAEKMARTLTPHLSNEEQQRLTKRDTKNPEAYFAYLKGRYFWWKMNPEEFSKSRDYFQQAVDADQTYALGYCGLNSYYGFGAAWGMLSPKENWPRAENAIMRALELDETLTQAHTGLAALKLVFYRDWDTADREARRALELNPRFEEAHYFYSFYLVAAGRIDEAIAEGKRALELDPFSSRINQHLGDSYYHGRRYDEAIKQYQEALELDSRSPSIHDCLGNAFEATGMHNQAVEQWEKALAATGNQKLATTLTRAFRAQGFDAAIRAAAEKKLHALEEKRTQGEYIPAIDYARVYMRLGDKEQALHWLEQAVQEPNVFRLLLKSDPLYDALREDSRFVAILKA